MSHAIPIIDFLYCEDCPSHAVALARLQTVLAERGLGDLPLRIQRIDDPDTARAQRFPGSPTIRIHGRDIDPAAASLPTMLGCRAYQCSDGRISPLPEAILIHRALDAALASAHPHPEEPSP